MGEPSFDLGRFWSELRRRKVVRVAIVYAIAAWILIQIAAETFEPLQLPEWALTLVIALAALGFPLALILAWALDITPEGIIRTLPAAAPELESLAATGSVPDSSIAVLAFADLSAEQDQGYFCEGMAEEIINSLTQLDGTYVASRTSSFRYRGSTIDVRDIGRELGVRHVLEGSVRKSGDQLRVTVQLIDVSSGYHTWSERYDRSACDVFAVQEDIACKAIDSLKLRMTPGEKRALQKPRTSQIDAYHYYLRGRQYFYKITREASQYAVQMFQRAIEIDSEYALAYAGLADTHSYAYMYTDCSEENLIGANEASRKALELNPELAEAHTSRALALSLCKRPDEAEKEFETALRLDPKAFEAVYFYARDRLANGHYEKAIELLKRAAEIRPEHYTVFPILSMAYRQSGQEEAALEAGRRGLQIISRYLELNPDDVRAVYLRATVLADLGEFDDAIEWAERALAMSEDPPVLYNVACVYALAGKIDEAFASLTRAMEAGFAHRSWIEMDGQLDSLHDDPRFAELLSRLK